MLLFCDFFCIITCVHDLSLTSYDLKRIVVRTEFDLKEKY